MDQAREGSPRRSTGRALVPRARAASAIDASAARHQDTCGAGPDRVIVATHPAEHELAWKET
jgi:hypothetical protein